MDSLIRLNEEKRKEEYQMQHFEFCSSQFTNEGKEEIMLVIEEAANALERGLFEKYQSVDRNKIHLATRNLIEAYSAAAEEWGPSFQEKMDCNFLCIPSHVLLDEDKPQEVHYSREEVERIDQEIRDLERKLIGSKYMKVKLLDTLKSAKIALRGRSEYLNSTRAAVPSCDLVKAVDEADRKRRKCHELDSCLLEGIPKDGNSNSEILLCTEIPGKHQYKVSNINLKLHKISQL